jgi:hypothetical protein
MYGVALAQEYVGWQTFVQYDFGHRITRSEIMKTSPGRLGGAIRAITSFPMHKTLHMKAKAMAQIVTGNNMEIVAHRSIMAPGVATFSTTAQFKRRHDYTSVPTTSTWSSDIMADLALVEGILNRNEAGLSTDDASDIKLIQALFKEMDVPVNSEDYQTMKSSSYIMDRALLDYRLNRGMYMVKKTETGGTDYFKMYPATEVAQSGDVVGLIPIRGIGVPMDIYFNGTDAPWAASKPKVEIDAAEVIYGLLGPHKRAAQTDGDINGALTRAAYNQNSNAWTIEDNVISENAKPPNPAYKGHQWWEVQLVDSDNGAEMENNYHADWEYFAPAESLGYQFLRWLSEEALDVPFTG